MKILLSTIKESSRDFLCEEALTLDSLTGRAEKGKVRVRVRVNPAAERWYLNGEVEGEFPFVCDRCRAPFTGRLGGDFTRVVLAKATPGLDPEESDEVIVLPGDSQELDLEDTIRETLLLDLPIQLLCDEACKGLCDHCGANLNAGPCDCRPEAEDPRWSALRDLKRMMESGEQAAGPDESEV